MKNTNKRYLTSYKENFKRDRFLLLMFMPCFMHTIIFCYLPLTGLIVAFEDFKVYLGIFRSNWVGFKNFMDFFSSYDVSLVIKNTLIIGLLSIATFPLPIIFALLLNELKSDKFKKSVQTISYIPFFLSTVVIISMVFSIFSPSDGIVNKIIVMMGFKPIYFIAEPKWFRVLYIGSGLWQGMGYGSIIYIAAISGVSAELYDAAGIDGCNRFGKMINVTLPGIMNTVIIMFILSVGRLLSVEFERVLLLQNPLNMDVSDVIQTYIYRKGLKNLNYGLATAVGLLNSLASFTLIVVTNFISRKISDTSIW